MFGRKMFPSMHICFKKKNTQREDRSVRLHCDWGSNSLWDWYKLFIASLFVESWFSSVFHLKTYRNGKNYLLIWRDNLHLWPSYSHELWSYKHSGLVLFIKYIWKENIKKLFSWEVYFGKNNSHLIHWKSVYLTLPKNDVICVHGSSSIVTQFTWGWYIIYKGTLSSKQWYIIIKTILL